MSQNGHARRADVSGKRKGKYQDQTGQTGPALLATYVCRARVRRSRARAGRTQTKLCWLQRATYLSDLATDCVNCPAGTSCSVGSAVPASCLPGSFTPVAKMQTCNLCDAGKYQDQTGQTGCKPCTAGYLKPHTVPYWGLKSHTSDRHHTHTHKHYLPVWWGKCCTNFARGFKTKRRRRKKYTETTFAQHRRSLASFYYLKEGVRMPPPSVRPCVLRLICYVVMERTPTYDCTNICHSRSVNMARFGLKSMTWALVRNQYIRPM